MFRKDEWLSQQIAKNVYQLKAYDLLENDFSQDWKEFKSGRIKENYFVFSKIRTDLVNIWQCLEKADFKLIDTNVKFELHGNISSKRKQQKDIGRVWFQIKMLITMISLKLMLVKFLQLLHGESIHSEHFL